MRAVAFRLAPLFVLCVFLVLSIFGAFELVERLWLAKRFPESLSLLHKARGIGSSFLVAGFVVWWMLRRAAHFPGAMVYGHGDPAQAQRESQDLYREHAAWLIQTRWVALLLGMALVVSACTVGILPLDRAFWPSMLLLAILYAANGLLGRAVQGARKPGRLLLVQLGMDLSALTVLLHFTGGIQNPLHTVYLVHAVLAGILLTRRRAFGVAATAAGLFGVLAALEVTGAWEAVPLRLSLAPEAFAVRRDPLYVGGYVLSFASLLFFITYFVSLAMARLRTGEMFLARAGQMAGIGELAGRVAHEVNNPAGIIKAKARLLVMDLPKGIPPERLREELDKIAQQAGRIGEITQGLLTFSRPSLGEKAPQDLNAIATEVLGLVDHTLRSAGIRLEQALAKALPPVHGNRGELRQVLLNLVTNAIDAMPTGGVLRVETSLEPPGVRKEARLRMVVKDTGGGVRPEDLERIFFPFFTTKPEGRGTGLGLSVSQGLVRSHGGQIEVESAPGRGSRFTVLLPASPAVYKGSA